MSAGLGWKPNAAPRPILDPYLVTADVRAGRNFLVTFSRSDGQVVALDFEGPVGDRRSGAHRAPEPRLLVVVPGPPFQTELHFDDNFDAGLDAALAHALPWIQDPNDREALRHVAAALRAACNPIDRTPEAFDFEGDMAVPVNDRVTAVLARLLFPDGR